MDKTKNEALSDEQMCNVNGGCKTNRIYKNQPLNILYQCPVCGQYETLGTESDQEKANARQMHYDKYHHGLESAGWTVRYDLGTMVQES